MTLKLQHPFTLIVEGPSACGKSTFVITLLECREQLCDTVYENIIWCHSENKYPHHLKGISFIKGVPDFDNPDHVPTLIVLDDLMDSAYSTKSANYLQKDHTTVTLVWFELLKTFSIKDPRRVTFLSIASI
jgi:ABC-type phosphate transport system ATPase subunit